jgi:2-polyprenyl-3-methyl-5-hydroxy-6-metoxy-1,4-benzoquinol methylase
VSSSASNKAHPVLLCPECHEYLAPTSGPEWACAAGHVVPMVADILDFRPTSLAFDVAADRRLAEELSTLHSASFEQLLRRYWESQPGVQSKDVDRFVTGDLIGGQRAAEVADQIEQLLESPLPTDCLAVEIGGGTGALGAELGRRCSSVIITDISLAWLVLARRRVQDMGLDNVWVVAATGESLPTEKESVDLIVAADVIEHVPNRDAVINNCYAALRPGGALWLSTPNRFSLTPEPHVRLWGVGLLPRRLGRAYVERRRSVKYDDIETLSVFALRQLVAATGGSWKVTAPEIASPVRATYGPLLRVLIDAYHLVRRLPVLRQVVLVITPLFHAVITRRRGDDG